MAAMANEARHDVQVSDQRFARCHRFCFDRRAAGSPATPFEDARKVSVVSFGLSAIKACSK